MSLKERVVQGAKYLDETSPGWYKKIDTRKLHMKFGCNCILGQLYGNYGNFLTDVENREGMGSHESWEWSAGLGFTLSEEEDSGSDWDSRFLWLELDKFWATEINKRFTKEKA